MSNLNIPASRKPATIVVEVNDDALNIELFPSVGNAILSSALVAKAETPGTENRGGDSFGAVLLILMAVLAGGERIVRTAALN